MTDEEKKEIEISRAEINEIPIGNDNEKKRWFTSWTIWINGLIGFVAAVLKQRFNIVLSPEELGGIYLIANIILRIKSDKGLKW